MTIVLIAEGQTEQAVRPVLKAFLDARCESKGTPKVRLDPIRLKAIGSGRKLRAVAGHSLARGNVACVVALRDVYPDFATANEAKEYLRSAMPADPRCRVHAAQYEFEAWLLPFWDDIRSRLGVEAHRPAAKPEDVDLSDPPSRRLEDLYAKAGRKYDKPRDGRAILSRNDLTIAATACPELGYLLNTLLTCAGLPPEFPKEEA